MQVVTLCQTSGCTPLPRRSQPAAISVLDVPCLKNPTCYLCASLLLVLVAQRSQDRASLVHEVLEMTARMSHAWKV
jgi:hypothetical protein